MALTFSNRRVGDVLVVSCAGQLVLGDEMAGLEAHLDAAIAMNSQVLLDLSEVSFIDSAALGMLVRYVCRTENATGVLRICAVSPAIDRALVVSRLKPVVQPFDSVETAIAHTHGAQRDTFTAPDILCVDESEDVLAYLRELLRNDGHHAMTATNLPDALTLMKATRPRVIVIGEAARAAAGTRSAEEFHRAAATCRVVNLPAGFAREDAGEAGRQVLAAIRHLVSETPDS